jgi:RAT1-interacting protein
MSPVKLLVGKYTGKTDTFVELKTSLVIRGHYDNVKFER